MWMFLCLMLSQKFLRLYSFLLSLFSFFHFFFGWILSSCLLILWFSPLLHLTTADSFKEFFISEVVIFISDWFLWYLYCFSYLLSLHLLSLISFSLLLRSLRIFITIILNSASGICVASAFYILITWRGFPLFFCLGHFSLSPHLISVCLLGVTCLLHLFWLFYYKDVLLGSVAQSFGTAELCAPRVFIVGSVIFFL